MFCNLCFWHIQNYNKYININIIYEIKPLKKFDELQRSWTEEPEDSWAAM